jgi:hypothetical protein
LIILVSDSTRPADPGDKPDQPSPHSVPRGNCPFCLEIGCSLQISNFFSPSQRRLEPHSDRILTEGPGVVRSHRTILVIPALRRWIPRARWQY